MSLSETYTLAHSAQCKLHLAVNRPDRDWRFVVGHAMHLDSLMLRIVEIEEGVEKSAHASYKIQEESYATHQSPVARQEGATSSPLPRHITSGSGEEIVENGYEDEEDGLALTRFSSGSARQPPPLDPSDDGSSSDEDDELSNMLPGVDSAFLKSIMKKKGDEELANMYNSISNCACQTSQTPAIRSVWELPEEINGETAGVRKAIMEIRS